MPAGDKRSSVTAAGRALAAGISAYERKDYSIAFRRFSQAAEAGDDREALYRLGLVYAHGQGVVANIADALTWYRKAAERGHAQAQYQLALAYTGP